MKSLEELSAIRERMKNKVGITDSDATTTRVLVGMATCGIASGARETMQAIIDELGKLDITNVSVTQTGCMGYCAEEPIIEVVSKDMPSVIYGHVTAKRGREIVNEHIKHGRLLQNAIISKSFEK